MAIAAEAILLDLRVGQDLSLQRLDRVAGDLNELHRGHLEEMIPDEYRTIRSSMKRIRREGPAETVERRRRPISKAP
jgi:hypothetical protein